MITSCYRTSLALRPCLREKKSERFPLFDILKIIAMTYVLIGHVLQRWYVSGFTATFGFSFFYSVSLALFFFVGGCFVKKTKKIIELLIYIIKLFVTYIVPAYLFTCLSIWLLPRFADHDFAFWMGELYYRTDTFYWFFLTAFLINSVTAIAYYIMSKLFKEKTFIDDLLKTLFMIVLLTFFASIFIYIYNAPDLGPGTLSANMFLYYLPISMVGYIFFTFRKYTSRWRSILLMRIIFFVTALMLYCLLLWRYQNWLIGLSGSFSEIAWHMVGSTAGVIVYYYFVMFICRFNIVQKVTFLAKYSGPFYLVHVFFIRLLVTYLPRPGVFDASAMVFIVLLTIGFYVASFGTTILMVELPLINYLFFGGYADIKKSAL